MKYFAEINENKVVQRIIVVESAEYAHELLGGTWVETFPDDINKNYANKNYIYVPKLENFYSPQPINNFVLDMTDLRWKPSPKTYYHLFFGNKPHTIITEKNEIYHWDENNNIWNEI